MRTITKFSLASVFLFILGLTGCGGGGSDKPPVNITPGQATVVVTPAAGGQATIQSATGVEVTLVIPPNAVTENVDVTVAIQSNIGAIPLAGQVALAVKLEPEGLQFSIPASLFFKSLSLPTDAVAVGYLANNDASHFQFIPAKKTGTDLQMEVLHFSSAGAMRLTDDTQKMEFFKQAKLQFDQLIVDISQFTAFDEKLMYSLYNRSASFALLWEVIDYEYPVTVCETPIELTFCSNMDDLYTQSAEYLVAKINEVFDSMNVLCEAGDQSQETKMFRWIIATRKFVDISGSSILWDGIDLEARRTCGIHTFELTPGWASLNPGESVGLFADVRGLNGIPLTNREIIWQLGSEPDSSIFSYSQNGQNTTVNALKRGTVHVFALDKVLYDLSNAASPSIPQMENVLGLLISTADVYSKIGIGNSLHLSPIRQEVRSSQLTTFNASLYIDNILQPTVGLVWEVADTSIANIDNLNEGVATIYAKNEGETTLTVRHGASGMSASAKISVSGLYVTVIPAQACLHPLETQQFTATVRDKHNRKLDLYPPFWQSSNSGTATINNSTGFVIASQEGDATITARVNLGEGVSYEGIAKVHVPTFPTDLVSTRVINNNVNSYLNTSDMKLTNARKLVHLNYGDDSVKNQIITRAAENGWVINPIDLQVVDVNVNDQAIVTYVDNNFVIPLRMDYDSSNYIELIPPGALPPKAIAMNDHGDVLLGEEYTAIYVYRDGNFTRLGPPAPYNYITGMDISNNGTVVGWLDNPEINAYAGFIYQDGNFTILTSPEGNVPPRPQHVNDDGLVITNVSFVYYQGTYYSFLPYILHDIDNASDIYLAEYIMNTAEFVPYIHHLCPLL